MTPNIYKFNIGSDFVAKASKGIEDFVTQLGQETVRIALSGGSSPMEVYERLSGSNIDWSKVELYIVDERADDSNKAMIEEALVSKLDNLKAFHPFDENYEQQIDQLTRPFFDLVILGLGPDGHTASIFPNTDAIEELEALTLKTESPSGVKERRTLSFPAILSTQKIVFLIRGANKKEVLEKLLDPDSSEYEIPAKLALEHDEVDIYFDHSK